MDSAANNSEPGNGAPYYRYEHGNNNAFSQPTSGKTDVDVGFPPMPVRSPDEVDPEVAYGRIVVARPERPGALPPKVETYTPWKPKGRDPQYRRDVAARRDASRRPADSEGTNTY